MPAISAVQTVQEQVVDSLRRLILDGDYSPGEKLRQEDLAELLAYLAFILHNSGAYELYDGK